MSGKRVARNAALRLGSNAGRHFKQQSTATAVKTKYSMELASHDR